MNTYTPDEIAAAKAKLPKPIAEFIDSKECSEAYKNIGTKHRLNVREMGIIYELSRATLLGLESEHDFVPAVRAALADTNRDTIGAVIVDVDTHVFGAARQKLKDATHFLGETHPPQKQAER